MQFIDLAAQYQSLKSKIDARIQAVLDHGQYIMGPEVQQLEEQLAGYTGAKHVLTCANGTDALQLALMALDVKPGDAVFCPTFTFFASAEAISFVGATPVFVDVDAATFNLCPNDLKAKIQAVQKEGKLHPKAIMAVDLFGLPADYPKLQSIAQQHGLKIIEDAAQGFGGSIDGRKACSFGDIATTSFFPAKPLGCYGDGGAVFTDDDALAELVQSLRVHGKGQDKYDNVRIGMNSRLDTIQAAILLEKLAAFPQELENRQALAQSYSSGLNKKNLLTPAVPEGFASSWAQYTLQSYRRDALMVALKKQGIPSVVYYGRCMHQQTAYKNSPTYGSLQISERLASSVLSLPMHPYLMSTSGHAKVLDVLDVILDSQ